VSIAIKLTIIVVMSTFPRQVIDSQLPTFEERQERVARLHAEAVNPPTVVVPETVPEARKWHPLPAVAPSPSGNRTTPEKVELGRRLFEDVNLSADRTVSCASCHDVTGGAGDDGRPVAVGIGGRTGVRNVPTVYNAAFQSRLFWDGRAVSLEQQAAGPLVNPVEMGMASLDDVEARVRERPEYRALFDEAFGDGKPITADRIVKAIAAYERTLVSNDAPYDRFVRGDEHVLTQGQKRGMALFQSLGCRRCHAGPNFSGASLFAPQASFQPFAVARTPRALARGLAEDKGRAGENAKIGVFRVPSLRNVALTAPYFHNGSVSDLSEAVRIMAAAQLGVLVGDAGEPPELEVRWSPGTGSLETVERTRIDDRDIADIVAFLRALSGDTLSARAAARRGKQ
ncbi:MAG: cytochrome c peroxidase, partial [Oricola sp.]